MGKAAMNSRVFLYVLGASDSPDNHRMPPDSDVPTFALPDRTPGEPRGAGTSPHTPVRRPRRPRVRDRHLRRRPQSARREPQDRRSRRPGVVARLWAHDGAQWTDRGDFYFIGFFTLDANVEIPAGTDPDDLPARVQRQISHNAHYARLICGDRKEFRVLVGRPTESRRFARALKVTPRVAGWIFGGRYHSAHGTFRRGNTVLKNRNGTPRRFETFGSATRSIQAFLDSAKTEDRPYLKALSRLAERCGQVRPRLSGAPLEVRVPCANETSSGLLQPRRVCWGFGTVGY